MNQEESIAFLSEVAFVAFPSVRQWLLTTDRYNETVKMMAKALSDITRGEADAVIDSWMSGRVSYPKYLRDNFVLEIRACAMHARGLEAVAKRQAEDDQKLEPVPEVMRSVQQSGLWTEHWLPLKAAVDTGELAASDAVRQWNAILDSQFSRRVYGIIESEPSDDY